MPWTTVKTKPSLLPEYLVRMAHLARDGTPVTLEEEVITPMKSDWPSSPFAPQGRLRSTTPILLCASHRIDARLCALIQPCAMQPSPSCLCPHALPYGAAPISVSPLWQAILKLSTEIQSSSLEALATLPVKQLLLLHSVGAPGFKQTLRHPRYNVRVSTMRIIQGIPDSQLQARLMPSLWGATV